MNINRMLATSQASLTIDHSWTGGVIVRIQISNCRTKVVNSEEVIFHVQCTSFTTSFSSFLCPYCTCYRLHYFIATTNMKYTTNDESGGSLSLLQPGSTKWVGHKLNLAWAVSRMIPLAGYLRDFQRLHTDGEWTKPRRSHCAPTSTLAHTL